MFIDKLAKITVAALLLVGLASVAADAKKVALVIGNNEYETAGVLRNPINDATAMTEKLQGLGFETYEGFDLSKDSMEDVLDDFSEAVIGSELAVLFYAGHAISVDGVNYLVPTDGRVDNPSRWKRTMITLDEILDILSYSDGPSVVFMDACRDNPLTHNLTRQMANSSRSVAIERGLSRMDPGTGGAGTAIAFATSPGNVADDGEGRHSPFTSALLNHIGAANISIADVMTRVTGEVKEATSGRQEPWFNMSLSEPLMLNPVIMNASVETTAPEVPAAPAATGGTSSFESEKFIFEMARESGDVRDYRVYLEQYPNGQFAGLVRNAISRIEQEEAEKETEVAALAQDKATAQPQTNITRTISGPLTLQVTPTVIATPSSQLTEQGLALNRTARRDLQNRLNALGYNVGGADGSLGPKSRAGIGGWQASQGIPATGYLNSIQYQLLVVQSEPRLAAYLASQPVRTTTQRTSSSTTTKKKSTTPTLPCLRLFGRGSGLEIGC